MIYVPLGYSEISKSASNPAFGVVSVPPYSEETKKSTSGLETLFSTIPIFLSFTYICNTAFLSFDTAQPTILTVVSSGSIYDLFGTGASINISPL